MTEMREPGQIPEPEDAQGSGQRWAEDPGVPVAPQRAAGQPTSPSRAMEEPTLVVDEPEPAAPAAEATPVPPPAQPSQWTPAVEPVTEPAAQPVVQPAPVESGEPATPEPAPVPVEAQPAPLVVPSMDAPAPTAWPVAPTTALPPVEATTAIYRDSAFSEETIVEPPSIEAQKLAAERAARKEAREAALAAAAPVAVAAPEPVVVQRRSNDLWAGSLGLFVLRLVVAAIFAVRGVNLLGNLPNAQELFGNTILPYPQIMPLVTGISSLLISLALVLGLLTRVAGLGVLLISVGALIFVQWGSFQIFTSPVALAGSAFLGELELLLAAVGLLFLLVGAGGWSFDRTFRAARAKSKAAKQAAKAQQH